MTPVDWPTIAVRRARYASDRAPLTCGCGVTYQPTPDGRHAHRIIVGHTPRPTVRRVPWSLACDAGLCRRCREACACGCHLAGVQG